MSEELRPGQVIEFPVQPAGIENALEDLEMVYGFIYARVGNRADAAGLSGPPVA